MPIYEYQCLDCGRIIDALIMKPEEERQVSCQACEGERLSRVLSRCVVHKTEAQRLSEFDVRAPRGEAFYRDDRNLGLSAKKRLSELGVDLGRHMDEIVEKARTGHILGDGAGPAGGI